MIIDAAELKRRYLLRIAGIRDKQAYIGPEVVTLGINNACNLTCRHCRFHAEGSPAHFEQPRNFQWEKFLEIIDDCVDLDVDQIHLTGAGEPTMHPRFRDMMRHLEQQPLKTRLYSNATFPLDYCADVIKGDHIVIDFSAVNRKQYMDIHGKDLFDRVVANIKRLVSLRDSGKPGFYIEIVYIFNTINVNQKQEMLDLASQLGVDSVYLRKMDVHAYNREIALPGTDIGEGERTPPACLQGWFYMKADLYDNLSTCCYIPRMQLGDIAKSSFKEIWLSKHMMNMRLLGKYGHLQKMYKACQTCPFYDDNIQRSQALAGLEEKEKATAL